MGKSKKIIFNLTIDDLRELGIIGKKRKRVEKFAIKNVYY